MNKITQRFYIFSFLPLVWFLVLILPGIVYSQETVQKYVLDFAQKSLKGYVNNVLNEKNFANSNFKSLKEASDARLGDPYKIMFIGLRSLQDYKPGTGVKPILMESRTLWFPVIVEGEIRTKLEIKEKKDKWVSGEFGGIRVVKEISKVRDQVPELIDSKGLSEPYKLMLLKIPALYAVFFYVESSQGEFLIPVMIQPQRYNLLNGQIYAADDVLSELREFADKIDGKKLR